MKIVHAVYGREGREREMFVMRVKQFETKNQSFPIIYVFIPFRCHLPPSYRLSLGSSQPFLFVDEKWLSMVKNKFYSLELIFLEQAERDQSAFHGREGVKSHGSPVITQL